MACLVHRNSAEFEGLALFERLNSHGGSAYSTSPHPPAVFVASFGCDVSADGKYDHFYPWYLQPSELKAIIVSTKCRPRSAIGWLEFFQSRAYMRSTMA